MFWTLACRARKSTQLQFERFKGSSKPAALRGEAKDAVDDDVFNQAGLAPPTLKLWPKRERDPSDRRAAKAKGRIAAF